MKNQSAGRQADAKRLRIAGETGVKENQPDGQADAKYIVVRTVGDLWKAKSLGLGHICEHKYVSLAVDVIEAALKHKESLEQVMALVQLATNIDKPTVINMPLDIFATLAFGVVMSGLEKEIL